MAYLKEFSVIININEICKTIVTNHGLVPQICVK